MQQSERRKSAGALPLHSSCLKGHIKDLICREPEGLNEESCQDPEEAEGCREVEKLYKSAILKISSSCETVSLVMHFFKNEIVKEGFM